MTFDISRNRFNPWKDYSGVVMEQGRVQTDADWNEWLAENARRIQAETLDILGGTAYPSTTPYAFQVTATSSGGANAISIGAGRMYVDGLLAENHGLPANAVWDPALAEFSGAPQPPPAAANVIDYSQQPYYPNPDTSLLSGNGPLLAYLDVWTRPVIYLQDDELIDPAIGIDTIGQIQTVWQVRLMAIPQGQNWNCQTPDSDIFPAPPTGLLTVGVVEEPDNGPCCLTTGSAYTGAENQCYRVEIHNAGNPSDSAAIANATFKWSRDNGSVVTGVTQIGQGSNALNEPAAILTVLSLGRDQVLGFLPGNWIELLDEAHQLNGIKGELYRIDSISAADLTITLTTPLITGSAFAIGTPSASSFTRIRRWDQSGKIYEKDLTTVWWDLDASGSDGSIPVPLSDTTLVLESGVTVTFGPENNAVFTVGDFWNFPARTAAGTTGPLTNAAPQGPHHHYAKLGFVTFDPPTNSDCRNGWPGPGAGGATCCTYTVGAGGKYSSIQQAIDALPAAGGEICILPGRYFENVVIKKRADIVIHGCGLQTRIASPGLDPDPQVQAALGAGETGLTAVITIVDSRHIELRGFAVEAGDADAGILLDHLASPAGVYLYKSGPSNLDIAISDLFITASEFPAIAGLEAELLNITDCRIAMADERITWPAIYVSGSDIQVKQNLVGLANAANYLEWVPASVIDDFKPTEGQQPQDTQRRFGADGGSEAYTPGGIQIGGPSKRVRILDNDIAGGAHNGVSLGNFIFLNTNGLDTGKFTGVLLTKADTCSTTKTIIIPGGTGSGSTLQKLGAGGRLTDIEISNNRITGMGLCGIGPVGFFDLATTLEIISIHNLLIAGNIITRSVLAKLDTSDTLSSDFQACAAISVPDVEKVIIRDNIVTDFGATPGAANVFGIFLLNAQMAEISRNQITETRDWLLRSDDGKAGTDGGGIAILLVTPPSFDGGSVWAGDENSGQSNLSSPIYEPGLPALRIEHNVVRVASGRALEAAGLGPFSIVNNHLTTGGTLEIGGTNLAMTVLLANLGAAIEFDSANSDFGGLYNGITSYNPGSGRALASATSGAILFTNNICQLEARASRQRGRTSILILSLDNVLFANNHSWIDAERLSAIVDTMVVSVSVQFNSNRLQEPIGSVLASGLTVGVTNVTSSNVSTACLFAMAQPGKLAHGLNITGISAEICLPLQNKLMPKGYQSP
jgi:hypothetical protein